MRSLENTLQGNRGLKPVDDIDRRLSQRKALKVVAKKLSGLWKFVVHLKLAERCGKWAPPDIGMLKRSRLAR
ncbi:TPA: hypothetical protein ACH3X1_011759 [Trebouxia sp. C0004]